MTYADAMRLASERIRLVDYQTLRGRVYQLETFDGKAWQQGPRGDWHKMRRVASEARVAMFAQLIGHGPEDCQAYGQHYAATGGNWRDYCRKIRGPE